MHFGLSALMFLHWEEKRGERREEREEIERSNREREWTLPISNRNAGSLSDLTADGN